MRQLQILLILTILTTVIINAKDYTQKRAVKSFISKMVKKHKFKRAYLNNLFKDVEFQQKALGIFNPKYAIKTKKGKKYPKHGSWDRYEKIHLGDTRVEKGVEYLRKYKNTFRRAYKKYGVPPEYITAIIGIESYYGNNVGKFPAFDTLVTLGFEENRRSKYFRYELKNLLILSKQNSFNPKHVKSSFAGAIGLGQFMPSSYYYAVDFNGDGKKSMMTTSDAIAGISNYFKRNGWRRGEPIATQVKYKGNRFTSKKTGYIHKYRRESLKNISPMYSKWNYWKDIRLIKLDRAKYDELWYGAKNFYVITRYNHSSYYAMAIHQLASKIRNKYWKKYGRF